MKKKKLLAFALAAMIAVGGFGTIDANATIVKDNMDVSMVWAGWKVTASNSSHTMGELNQCYLFVYSKAGCKNLITSGRTEKIAVPAGVTISKIKTKSAYAKHYAFDDSTGKLTHHYTKKMNKGNGY